MPKALFRTREDYTEEIEKELPLDGLVADWNGSTDKCDAYGYLTYRFEESLDQIEELIRIAKKSLGSFFRYKRKNMFLPKPEEDRRYGALASFSCVPHSILELEEAISQYRKTPDQHYADRIVTHASCLRYVTSAARHVLTDEESPLDKIPLKTMDKVLRSSVNSGITVDEFKSPTKDETYVDTGFFTSLLVFLNYAHLVLEEDAELSIRYSHKNGQPDGKSDLAGAVVYNGPGISTYEWSLITDGRIEKHPGLHLVTLLARACKGRFFTQTTSRFGIDYFENMVQGEMPNTGKSSFSFLLPMQKTEESVLIPRAHYH